MDGWIVLYRKITDWEWYKDINTKTVFLHLLLSANIKPGKYKGLLIKRGELVTTLTEISEKTNLSKMEVRTALKHLKSTGEITDKITNKFRVITVVNYGVYQDKPNTKNKQNNSRITHNKQTVNIQLSGLEEQEEQLNKETIKDTYRLISDMFNEICVSFPRCTVMNDKRKKAIKARFNKYTAEDFKKVFELAEASDFLKGGNSRSWSADFDWLIKDDSMKKVLNGNYKNVSRKNSFTGYSQRSYDFEAYEKEERNRRKKYLEEKADE